MPDEVEHDTDWGPALSEQFEKADAAVSEAPAAGAESAAPATPAEATPSTDGAPEVTGRDDKGRFVAKPAAAAKGNEAPRPTSSGAQAGAASGAPGAVAPAGAAPVAPPAPLFKPPQSWKPALREKWSTLPAEVQAEVDRREREIVKALQTSAEAEKGTGAWNEVVRPYEAQIRSAGGNPQQYVGSLLQTAHALAYGHPQQKADIVATLAMQFAVSPQDLDQALVARMNGQQGQQRPVQPPIDEEAILRRVEERAQAAADERFAAIELEKARPGLEYFDDLAEDMAKVIDGGLATNYQEAYALALQLPKNSETLALVKQKEAVNSAANAQASTQRARAAASSVRSTPGGSGSAAPPGDNDDWETHLNASWDRLAAR